MPQIGLDSLRPGAANKGKKRVGRGTGSGHGKTSGKGHKGQKARAGGVKGAAFEGGQLPLQRRLPKRGFTNAPFAREWRILNLALLSGFAAGSEVNEELLVDRGLLRGGAAPVKILGDGELGVALTVVADAFSAGAKEKIEAAGGRAVVKGEAAGAAG